MREYLKFYIDGQWVDPIEPKSLDVDNPTTEQVSGKIAIGSAADVDKAVKAARKAFATWSVSSREERLDLLQSILAEYQKKNHHQYLHQDYYFWQDSNAHEIDLLMKINQ